MNVLWPEIVEVMKFLMITVYVSPDAVHMAALVGNVYPE
jgi:hypothetical protein